MSGSFAVTYTLEWIIVWQFATMMKRILFKKHGVTAAFEKIAGAF